MPGQFLASGVPALLYAAGAMALVAILVVSLRRREPETHFARRNRINAANVVRDIRTARGWRGR